MPTDAQYRAEEAYSRARYDLIRRNQATLDAVNKLATDETLTVLGTAVDLERDVYAGFLRKTLPPLLDKWGNVNAQAAMAHYESARDAWQKAHGKMITVGQYTAEGPYTVWQPGNDIQRERNYASKVLQGRLYQATLPKFNPEELANPVIDAAMKGFVKTGPLAGNDAAANAMTRQLGSYYRDTMLFNAGLDESVQGVQRIVNANGCAWCKTLAVGGMGRSRKVVLDFAAHFHAHCRCTIEPLYAGDKPLRPDYYDDIERDLKKAQTGDYDTKGQRSLQKGASTNETMRGRVQALRSVERSKGVPSSVPSGTQAVREAIRTADTGAGVAHILGKHLGDTPVLGFDKPGLHLDSLKDIADTLVGLKEEYPFINLSSVNVVNPSRGFKNAYAWATGRANTDSMISYNAHFLDASRAEEVAKQGVAEADNGWKMPVARTTPKWVYTTAHEFGHVLDYSRNVTGRNGNLLKFRVKAVQKAVLKMKGLTMDTPEAYDFLRSQNSRYGKTNEWEYVAESFADYHLSGDNAQEMSKAVVEALLKEAGAKKSLSNQGNVITLGV